MVVQVTEGSFAIGEKSLYTKSWLPGDENLKARVVLVHGYSDHISRYADFCSALAECGIAVYGFDQRGWGRSVRKPSERGLSGPTKLVLSDIVAFLRPHLDAPDGLPVFVIGHSMGGGELLMLMGDPMYQDDVVARVRGWLLEAPLIGLTQEQTPSAITVAAGRLLGRIRPNWQMKNVIPPENLSRDPAVVKSIKEDELCHDTGTLQGLAGMLDRTMALSRGKVRPTEKVRNLWVGHGTLDKATSFEATMMYFEKCTRAVKNRQMRVYEGWYHQLHCDGPDGVLFRREVAEWILEQAERE